MTEALQSVAALASITVARCRPLTSSTGEIYSSGGRRRGSFRKGSAQGYPSSYARDRLLQLCSDFAPGSGGTLDRAVLDAYGWDDISTDCEFVPAP